MSKGFRTATNHEQHNHVAVLPPEEGDTGRKKTAAGFRCVAACAPLPAKGAQCFRRRKGAPRRDEERQDIQPAMESRENTRHGRRRRVRANRDNGTPASLFKRRREGSLPSARAGSMARKVLPSSARLPRSVAGTTTGAVRRYAAVHASAFLAK